MRLALGLALAVALPWIAGCDEFEIVSSCSDHLENGAESDVDCGGSDCPRCALGRMCREQKDCFAGDCDKGICTPTPVAVWTQIMPMGAPPKRMAHAMTFDKTGTLLYGGTDAAQRFGDTWRWDGMAWNAVMSMMAPPGRAGAVLVFDVGLERTLLFGGSDLAGKAVVDAWSFSGAAWTQLAAAMGPTPRNFPAATYDTNAAQIVLFGGYSSAELGDTWTRQGITWQMIGTPGPPSRSSSGMVYAIKQKRAVLFGGAIGPTPPIPDLSDTWTWDGSTWKNASPAVSPSPRYGAAMAYDQTRDRVILFGGIHETTTLGDTWEWDGEGWKKPQGPAPSAREYAAMTYDPARRRVVLFGGSPDGMTYLDDTWEYHVVGNPCKGVDDCDTGHCVDGLCCESASCGACEACNLPASPGQCTACGTACADGGACAP